MKNFCVYSCKVELDQIVSGLNSLRLGDLMRDNPDEFLSHFLQKPVPLTAAMLQDLFTSEFSSPGANVREAEEEAAMQWVMLLSDIEEGGGRICIQDNDSSNGFFYIAFADLLMFVTGSSSVPPMGFLPKPVIQFSYATTFPIASTCSNTLTLPLDLPYESFRYNIGFGIHNSPGFLRI